MPHVELPQAEFKVVMLGDTFTGKTSLVLRFAEGHYRESKSAPTVGAFFITKRLSVQGLTCKLQIWDTAGQEQFKRLAPMYYKNAAAAIICYDVTSPKSFETLRYWVDELQQNVPAGQIVLAMCATKCDLMEDPDTSAAERLAQMTGAMFMKTSAKQNDNVSGLFQHVTERVLQFQKNPDISIPVTMAVTSVESSTNDGSGDNHPAHAQPRLLSGPLSSSPQEEANHNDHHHHQNNDNPKDSSMILDEEKKEIMAGEQDEDNNNVDPTMSKESQEYEKKSRCGTGLLMCEAQEAASGVMGDRGSSCTIQ